MKLSTFAFLIFLLAIALFSVGAKKKGDKKRKENANSTESVSASIEEAVEGCKCEEEGLRPVCSTNWKTYKNKCVFKCAKDNATKKRDSEMRIKHKGACPKKKDVHHGDDTLGPVLKVLQESEE